MVTPLSGITSTMARSPSAASSRKRCMIFNSSRFAESARWLNPRADSGGRCGRTRKWRNEAANDHDDPTTSAIRIAAIRNVCSDAASRVGADGRSPCAARAEACFARARAIAHSWASI